MLIGLLSDIHGRFDALELAYSRLAKECDQIVCLGDIVNGGGDAEACISLIREKQLPTVRGNHDDAWLAMCGLPSMASANFTYVRDLPVWIDHSGLILVHDDPVLACNDPEAWRNGQGYILKQFQAESIFASAPVFLNGPRLTAIGHTHVPAVFTTAGEITLRDGEPVLLPKGHSCILNPGAVGGRARSAWGNSFAVLDTEENTFTVHRIALPKTADPWDEFFDRMQRSR